VYTKGVGTEDFEECERSFFASNDLAPLIWMAAPCHHRQVIQKHFNLNDSDRQMNIGKTLATSLFHELIRPRSMDIEELSRCH
jgi:hypothetical protein